MKILLTNDDGIDSPGLAALLEAARPFGEPVLVAPAEHHSGCSHRVTTNQPLRLIRRPPHHFAVAGTPADCVRVGLSKLMPDAGLVLSGVNVGGNLGADVWYSGTVAAVREAVLHGYRGIAFSQFVQRGRSVDWRQTAAWTTSVLRELLSQPWQPGQFWNVNFPHLEPDAPQPETVFCPLDPSPLPLDFRMEEDYWQYMGDYHQRRRREHRDVDVCFRGRIAATRIVLF